MPKKLKLIPVETFRSQARDGAPGGDVGVLRASVFKPKAVGDDAARTLRFCYSDGSQDRADDTIDPKGWELESFLVNPVSLWAHCSWDPPIGKASEVKVEGLRLMGNITFALAEEYAFADTIYRLTKGGYINACSVGFIPHEWKFSSDKDRPYGIDFIRQELLEISPCPVPCNPNALVEARAAGIDTAPLRAWAEKVLDDGNFILLPRAEIEQLRKAADGTGRTVAPPIVRTEEAAAEVEEPDEATPMGNCGRLPGDECGMTDPTQCAVHATSGKAAPAPRAKAGRVLSAANEADLRAAVELIEGVLEQVDPESGDEGGTDPAGTTEPDDKAAERERLRCRARLLQLQD